MIRMVQETTHAPALLPADPLERCLFPVDERLLRPEPSRHGALRIFVHERGVRLALQGLPAGRRAGPLAMLRRQDRRDAQLHFRARRFRSLPVHFPRTRMSVLLHSAGAMAWKNVPVTCPRRPPLGPSGRPSPPFSSANGASSASDNKVA